MSIYLQLVVMAATFATACFLAVPLIRYLPLPQQPGGRYLHLDGLRGLAALMVVAAHASQFAAVSMGLPGAASELQRQMGSVGVLLFFALTGFLFTDRALAGKLEPLTFFAGRIRRIVPLWLAVCTATVAACALLSPDIRATGWDTLSHVMRLVLYGFTGTQPVAIFGKSPIVFIALGWTLSWEWTFYLLLPVFFGAASISRTMARVTLIVVAGFIVHNFWLGSGQSIWAFFLPGVLTALIRHQFTGFELPSICGLIGLAALLLAIGFPTPGVKYGVFHLVMMTTAFATLFFSSPGILKHPVAGYLGTISYSIYLWQFFALYPLRDLGPLSQVGGVVAAMAAVAGLVLLSTLSFRFIEWPFLAMRKEGPAATAQRQF